MVQIMICNSIINYILLALNLLAWVESELQDG